jgi:hypothetical protein
MTVFSCAKHGPFVFAKGAAGAGINVCTPHLSSAVLVKDQKPTLGKKRA